MKFLEYILRIFTPKTDNKIEELINQNKELLKQFNDLKAQNLTQTVISNNEEQKTLITSFEINNNDAGVKFEAIEDDDFLKKLPIINLNRTENETVTSTLSSILGGGSNIALSSWATNGLFKATVNPSTLMKLSSGGVGSMVVKNGAIIKQAGFIQAGTTMFTPMVIFQIASIVTGQYYMNNISKQLNSVQEKLDELLNLFHIERQAKLVKSFKFISENLRKKNFVIEDFVLLKIILSELADIREEYFLMLEDSVNKIKKNNKYESISSLKEAKFISSEFIKTGFIFKMKTSLIADELYHLSKITEFHMNLCYKNPDINRINILSEKLVEISNFKQNDLCFSKTENLYLEIKNDTLHQLSNSEKQSWFNPTEIQEIKSNISNLFIDFEKVKTSKLSSISKTYKDLVKPFEQKKTIILDNRHSDVKMYLE